TEQLGGAVEIQPAVDTEDRHAAILVAVEALVEDPISLAQSGPPGVVQRQVVACIGVLGGRLDEAPVPVQGQADTRLQVQPLALGTGQPGETVVIPAVCRGAGIAVTVRGETTHEIALEADEFRAVVKAQAAGLIGQGTVQGQLREALVGCDVGDGGTFEGLYIERGAVVVALPGETAPLVEKVALI